MCHRRLKVYAMIRQPDYGMSLETHRLLSYPFRFGPRENPLNGHWTMIMEAPAMSTYGGRQQPPHPAMHHMFYLSVSVPQLAI